MMGFGALHLYPSYNPDLRFESKFFYSPSIHLMIAKRHSQIMLSLQESEEKVRQAVREFAASKEPDKKIFADMTPLTEATAELPLSNIDYWERLIWREYEYAAQSQNQSKWKIWPSKPSPLTWLDLCSRNGYTRERALRTLSGPAPNRLFLAFAVRRLNDWVPQVRVAARDAVPIIAKDTDPSIVVEVLCLSLFRMESWGRMEDADKNALLGILSAGEISAALKQKIERSSSGPLASILAQVGRTAALDGFLAEIAFNSVQPAVRAKAYRCQLEGKMTWTDGRKWVWTDKRYCEGRLAPIVSERKLTEVSPFQEVIKMASVDRSPIVRRVAAEMLIRNFAGLGDYGFQLAKHFANDRSHSVAEQGRFAMKQLERAKGGSSEA